ncbi:MAG TPA: hypothetical protein VF692_13910 [Pyrinomonadaceae bacterium]|jgi:hypothetical protein
MSKTRHEKSFVDYDKPYEQNLIGLRGIIWFAGGLILLIVITFGLMLVLLNFMEAQARESKDETSPLMMTDKERLPPEPRLQAAPGFGVDSEQGRVNLELRAPQSEYWELREQWENQLRNGQRDPHSGSVVTMPVDQAKDRYVQQSGQNAAANQNADGQKNEEEMTKSRMYASDSSSGRVLNEKWR